MSAWLTWTLVALLSWGLWGVLSRGLGDTLSPGLGQALSTVGLLPILVALAGSGRVRLRGLPVRDAVLAVLGGVVTCLGNLAYYDALARGEQVAAVMSLTALAPLVTVLLAFTILRERLNRVQQAGVLLSLVAIGLFNLQPGSGWVSRAVVYAILPCLFWGLSGFLQKLSTDRLSAETAALLYLGAFVPVALGLAIREPWPASLKPSAWLLVLALGFFLAFGNYAVIAAFARGGKASVIAPLGGLYPLLSVPLAVAVFGDPLRGREAAGLLVAAASVAALSWEGRTAAPTHPAPALPGAPAAPSLPDTPT